MDNGTKSMDSREHNANAEHCTFKPHFVRTRTVVTRPTVQATNELGLFDEKKTVHQYRMLAKYELSAALSSYASAFTVSSEKGAQSDSAASLFLSS